MGGGGGGGAYRGKELTVGFADGINLKKIFVKNTKRNIGKNAHDLQIYPITTALQL